MDSDITTKERILDASYRMFVKKGFKGSSMRDIAQEAGIKAGSIYNHFGGKEEIFEAVFIEKHPMFTILKILDDVRGENAEELITNAVNKINREMQREPDLLNLFFVELVEMNGDHIATAIKKNFPTDSEFMKQIFNMKSELRDIREPVLVRAIIGTVFANMMFNWFIGESNVRRWGNMAEMTDVLMHGILRSK